MAQATAVRAQATPQASRFIAQVYLVMSLGLVVTALVAGWVSTNMTLLIRLSTNPWLAWGLFIVQIILVGILVGAVQRMTPAVAFLIFIAYSALTGLTISTIFLVYTNEQIASVFWFTAGMFFLTSIFGLVTKRDLSGAGNDEQTFAILFDLGALMGASGILDCQWMKSELFLQAVE